MELWERQERESGPRWEAFQTYRNMPPGKRSTNEVAKSLGKAPRLIHKWSSEDKWQDRCEAYDRYLDAEATARRIEGIAEMNKRHIDVAEKILEKAANGLDYIDPEDIRPSDVAKLVDTAAKLERLARGDATEVVENREGESIVQAVQFYMPDNGRDGDGTGQGD